MSVWPQVRGVLVALHVAAVIAMATPSAESGMKRSAWKDPTVQEEFRAWNARFAAVGWRMTQDQLEERLWTFATRYEALRSAVVRPFERYGRYVGANQSWRMFVAPHRYPTRLHIDLEENGVWRPIYIERSPDATWNREALDHDRMRSAIFRFGWSQYKRSYEAFADWVARRAALDFPDATRVRVRMYKVQSPTAREVLEDREPVGRFQQERIVKLVHEATP